MFFCYLLIVLKFISSSSASESGRNRHASELKNRTRRDLTYQNSLGNHLYKHHTSKIHRNSPYGSKTGMRESDSIFHGTRYFQPIFSTGYRTWKFQSVTLTMDHSFNFILSFFNGQFSSDKSTRRACTNGCNETSSKSKEGSQAKSNVSKNKSAQKRVYLPFVLPRWVKKWL